MAAIARRLAPDDFVRVHRSHIVNLNCVAEIEPLETGDARLKLRDGSLAPCSRTFHAALRQRSSGSSERLRHADPKSHNASPRAIPKAIESVALERVDWTARRAAKLGRRSRYRLPATSKPPEITISTRLLRARPSAVVLSATGRAWP